MSTFTERLLEKVHSSARTRRKHILREAETVIAFGHSWESVLERGLLVVSDDETARALLVGSKSHRGLFAMCGEHEVSSDLTKMSMHAMSLLAKLLDVHSFPGAPILLGQLPHVPLAIFESANFQKHLVAEASSDAKADILDAPMFVISRILCGVPKMELSYFIREDWARFLFLKKVIENCTKQKGNPLSSRGYDWDNCIRSPNYAQSMITEFLITSSTRKQRVSRLTWIANIQTYILNYSPVMHQETIDQLLVGTEKNPRGLIHLCGSTDCNVQAKQLLYKLLDPDENEESKVFRQAIPAHKETLKCVDFTQKHWQQHSMGLDFHLLQLIMQCPTMEMRDILPKELAPIWQKIYALPGLDEKYELDPSNEDDFYSETSLFAHSLQTRFAEDLHKKEEAKPAKLVSADWETTKNAILRGAGAEILALPSVLSDLEEGVQHSSLRIKKLGDVTLHEVKMMVGMKDILQQFFVQNSARFPLRTYRRLLIFVKCMADIQQVEEFEALFERLELNSDPRNEEIVIALSDQIHTEMPDFVNIQNRAKAIELWVCIVLQEIARIEKKLDG